MSKVHRLTLYFLFHLLSSCFCHYYPVKGNSNNNNNNKNKKKYLPGRILSIELQRTAITSTRRLRQDGLSTTRACNLTRGFCENAFVRELRLAHLDGRLGPL